MLASTSSVPASTRGVAAWPDSRAPAVADGAAEAYTSPESGIALAGGGGVSAVAGEAIVVVAVRAETVVVEAVGTVVEPTATALWLLGANWGTGKDGELGCGNAETNRVSSA